MRLGPLAVPAAAVRTRLEPLQVLTFAVRRRQKRRSGSKSPDSRPLRKHCTDIWESPQPDYAIQYSYRGHEGSRSGADRAPERVQKVSRVCREPAPGSQRQARELAAPGSRAGPTKGIVMFASVTRQLKRAMSAVKSVLAIAGTAAAALDPTLRSHLREGESIDGIEPLMLTLIRWIQSDHDRLEACEAEQRGAQRQLKKLRLRRDRRQEALYGLLLRIRGTFEDAFGQGTAAVYLGLDPRIGKLDPVAFRRQAQETASILADPGLTLPQPAVQGLWENPAQYAAQILELLDPYQSALDAIESQKREVEKTQKTKVDLLEQLGGRLTWSIRLFEAIYQLADLGFYADRLRLTVSSRPSAGEAAEASGEDKDSEAGSEEPAVAESSSAADSPSGG